MPASDKRIRLEWFDIKAEVAVQAEAAKERHPHLFVDKKTSTLAKREVVAWLDLFRRNCWRRTMVGVGIMFFQQFVGINALIYYSPSLFEQLGQGPDLRLILAGVLNVTQLVGVMTSLWSMDHLGRKPLLLGGSACMFVAHFIIAVLVGLFSDNWSAHTTEGWVSVAFLFFYMLGKQSPQSSMCRFWLTLFSAFGATWGPVPWALPAEVFPSSLRAKGVAICES